MKGLVCAKDVEAAGNRGEKVIYIDTNTIITPSAKDVAIACGIEFCSGALVCEPKGTCEEKTIKPSKVCEDGLDSEMIYNLFKVMMDKGLLKELIDSISNTKPYIFETASNGLKVVRGDSVKYDVFDTGNPDANVSYQEIISKDESSMGAGFLTIDHSKFDREIPHEETDYVIEGILTVTINGQSLTAYPGDVLYVPSGSKVTWSSAEKAKVFYVTNPAKKGNLL